MRGQILEGEPKIVLNQAAQNMRVWYEDGPEFLYQLQKDRLYLNWRRQGNYDLKYPGFPVLLKKLNVFRQAVKEYFSGAEIEPNYVEVGYINVVNNMSNWTNTSKLRDLFNLSVDLAGL